jgi:hypothetical protein
MSKGPVIHVKRDLSQLEPGPYDTMLGSTLGPPTNEELRDKDAVVNMATGKAECPSCGHVLTVGGAELAEITKGKAFPGRCMRCFQAVRVRGPMRNGVVVR